MANSPMHRCVHLPKLHNLVHNFLQHFPGNRRISDPFDGKLHIFVSFPMAPYPINTRIHWVATQLSETLFSSVPWSVSRFAHGKTHFYRIFLRNGSRDSEGTLECHLNPFIWNRSLLIKRSILHNCKILGCSKGGNEMKCKNLMSEKGAEPEEILMKETDE